ncbi:ABC transporter permease subunit [Georgenia yuyongxinii]|uniref:Maltose/maltodextrin transport system permease protein n=1 Tax=Georgenia yuyongxinii TaxID=2589797 RepID=A0A5B8C2K1_9MICO|nr:ABC transporter permease subunit [Georgenia yuyongxinii]QDC24774.1 ABC transporter permease subunit [Georgenia yuyongxinii]
MTPAPRTAERLRRTATDLPRTDSHARRYGPGFLAKLAAVGLVDALGVYGIFAASAVSHWGIVAVLAVALIAVNWVYFSRRMVPAKYLVPGLFFLLIYQLFVMAYTGYVSFTNYGDGHNSTKEDAITAILLQNDRRVEGSPTVPLAVVREGETLGFAVVQQDGDVAVGSAEEPLAVVDDAVVEGDRITAVPGWEVLPFGEVARIQQEVTGLRVPLTEDPNDGAVRTQNGSSGFISRSFYTYDAAADTMTNTDDGTLYRPSDSGSFVAEDGRALTPGWRVPVGLDNYVEMFTSSRVSGPFFQVLAWTFAFAALSVLTTFALGLFLAMVFNDPRVRGRRLYRVALILPYAIPGFLGTLVWRGMLNERFGFLNEVILGGASIPWLNDPWLAKLSVIGVNLWIGFPYMFLICTGALQSIPGDVIESARMDGAGRLRIFRSITLPLLLVSTAPLLIASFAFNFNNFNLIYMLTGGGPNFPDAPIPLGATDILITMVYSTAFEGGQRDYGLASAMSIVIFIIVGLVAWLGFRQTRKLEEI